MVAILGLCIAQIGGITRPGYCEDQTNSVPNSPSLPIAQLENHRKTLEQALTQLLDLLQTSGSDEFLADISKCLLSNQRLAELLIAGAPEDERLILHDIRNQVGVIRGYLEMMLEECAEAGLAALESSVITARDLADGMLQLIEPRSVESARDISSIEESTASSTLSTDPGRLLVIDDEESSRDLLMRHLAKRGHTVFGAASGQQALEVLKTEPVDLIFVDLVMPEMDGLELLRAFKQHEELRIIPVIVVSGIQDTNGVIECIEAGAEDYLYKPFNPVLLRARLRAGLQRKRWHDREQEYLQELERSHRFIRNTFGRYLSDEIVDALLETPEGLDLGGTTTAVTILMADIRNFTTLSEHLRPESVVKLLNNYLGEMSEIIMRHSGTVDEFIGDGILAIFGAPVTRSDDARRAIRCALEMQASVERINEQNRLHDLPDISIGIGLNTGTVVAGNIGSEKRSKYGVVGHAVNLTARIESYTSGGETLASMATIEASGSALSLGRQFDVKPKGMADEVAVAAIEGLTE